MAQEQNRDLLLSPDTFLYMQNEGKNGIVSVYCGPGVVNQTGQDKPVIYDSQKRKYLQVTLEQAVQYYPSAQEGDYVILENPAKDETQFPAQPVQQSASLNKGRKIIIPGPWSNSLWPGQTAKVLQGHRLRSNQYLVVVIYNEDEAKKNWNKAIVKKVGEETVAPITLETFTVGQRFIVKGTEVSFYIPPTGVEVVPDNGNYVREAVTLEQLEYSILVDENGKKRYPRGPAVVFPEPTEQFIVDPDGKRKFPAVELNDIQGIHVKVIQPYEEGDQKYKEGQELFITGKDTAIYFPRKEHSIIRYGDNTKHYSTAVPAGEGRYVMDRTTGEIRTAVGPKMLLPDPRNQVLVRRILTEDQCRLWYPGNQAAVDYNKTLRELSQTQPSARSGFVSEGDYQKNTLVASAMLHSDYLESAGKSSLMPQSFQRGTTYSQPRQLTLETKYEGVPGIMVFTGYAVMVVSKRGDRRVVVGPSTILLDYDQSLEVLTFSTGKPKTTDKLERSVFLRVKNNKISDVISVETSDHVRATVKISLCVNFEGDPNLWFDVENYVKFLTDHIRSILKGKVKKLTVEDFYANSASLIRDAVLGEKTEAGRAGRMFTENGMRVSDVEVLAVDLDNPEISKLLTDAQYQVVRQDIELNRAKKSLEITQAQEMIAQQQAAAKHTTATEQIKLQIALLKQQLESDLAKAQAELDRQKLLQSVEAETQSCLDVTHRSKMIRGKAEADQQHAIATDKAELETSLLMAQTEACVKRLTATKDNLAEALVALSREETMVKVAQAFRIEGFMAGSSIEAVLAQVFGELPIFRKVLDRIKEEPSNGNRLLPTTR